MTPAIAIPLLQSLITALLLAPAAICCRWAYRQPQNSWALFFAAFFIIALISWLVGIARYYHYRDAEMGLLPPASTTMSLPEPFELNVDYVRVGMVQDEPSGFINGAYFTIPLPLGKLQAACTVLHKGASFGYASLAGLGKPLTRSEFELLRDCFLQHQIVRWVSPSSHMSGLTLTGHGRALIKFYAAPPEM